MKLSARAGQQVMEITIESRNGHYVVEVDGRTFHVDSHKLEGDFYSFLTDGRSYEVSVEAKGDGYQVRHGAAELTLEFSDPSRRAREGMSGTSGPEKIITQMPGKIARVLVGEGDTVEVGQGIVVVEAMKMENEIAASRPGRVSSVDVAPGQTVEGGAVLVVIEQLPQ
jgi:biotin carboxyl carrier protein